jgi:hypothetical protein
VTRTVTVAAQKNVRVEIDMPARKGASQAVASTEASGSPTETPPAPRSGAEPATSVSTEAPAAAHPGRAGRITGIALAGVGVGLDVAGLILRSSASSKMNAIQSEALTGATFDTQYSNWQTYDHASVALLIAGTAAIAAGAAVYVFNLDHGGSAESAGAQVSMGFVPGTGGGSLHLGGRF